MVELLLIEMFREVSKAKKWLILDLYTNKFRLNLEYGNKTTLCDLELFICRFADFMKRAADFTS